MNKLLGWIAGITTAAFISYVALAPRFSVVKNSSGNTYQMTSKSFPTLAVNYMPSQKLFEIKGQLNPKNPVDNRLFFDYGKNDIGLESRFNGIDGSFVYNNARDDLNLDIKKNNTGLEATLDNNTINAQSAIRGRRLWSWKTKLKPFIDRLAFTSNNYGSLEYLRGNSLTSYII